MRVEQLRNVLYELSLPSTYTVSFRSNGSDQYLCFSHYSRVKILYPLVADGAMVSVPVWCFTPPNIPERVNVYIQTKEKDIHNQYLRSVEVLEGLGFTGPYFRSLVSRKGR